MRWLCCIGYDGGGMHGVAPQAEIATVGGSILLAAHDACGQTPYAVSVCSRTDAGVHAQCN